MSATSNRLSSVSGGLVRSYTYNNSGSVLTSGVATHTYYNSGRMKTGKLGSAGATTYVYNALGQRIKKSGGAVSPAVYFMYDEAGHLVGEYTISGTTVTPVQETVWLGDIPVATIRGTLAAPTIFYVHSDQLNTPRKVTNTANQLRWKWDPGPFGDGGGLNENPASLGTFKYHLRFPGQYFDLEANLNYNYFRDYDASTGRYTQSDPIGLGGGVNTYSYVSGNPVMSIDRLGLQAAVPAVGPGGALGPIINSAPIAQPGSQANTDWASNAWNQIDGGLSALGNAIGNIGRPKDMTREEESLYDRYCKGEGDPCPALKALTMSEIVQARTKMDRMLTDPKRLYGTDGWFNHQDDLRGRVNKIFNLISLGQKLGCDMTAETIAATGLMVPSAPL